MRAFAFAAGCAALAGQDAAIAPKSGAPSLGGVFVITEQSPTLDWWMRVPANTGAQVNPVRKVYPGQTFSVIPFVSGYGLTDDNRFEVSYSLTRQTPDAAAQFLIRDFSLKGTSPDARLLQAPAQFLQGAFNENDPFGTYHFTLKMKDAVSGVTYEKEETLELAPWKRPADNLFTAAQLQHGYIGYYASSSPDWLWLSFLSPDVSLEQTGSAHGFNFVLLSFYKHAFERYVFLVPDLDKAFDTATAPQRLKIVLLYALLGKPPIADARLNADERAYQTYVRQIPQPDPYAALDTPESVEWLWGEFFATGNYKPLRRMCDAFLLLPYAQVAERVLKTGGDEIDDEKIEAYWKGKAFGTFMRTALLYGANSPLARQYLGYVLENESLPPDSRTLLLAVMKKLWPGRYDTTAAQAPKNLR